MSQRISRYCSGCDAKVRGTYCAVMLHLRDHELRPEVVDPCYVRRLWKEREQGRDIYVQSSEWFAPYIDSDGIRKLRSETHPEWDVEPLKASGDLADVIERRPWPQ